MKKINPTCFRIAFSVLVASIVLLTVYFLYSQNSEVSMSKNEKDRFWIWAKQAGGEGITYGSDIAVDSSGNAYVTGFISGKIQFLTVTPGKTHFDETEVIHKTESDFFLAKYQLDGSLGWVKQLGERGLLNGRAVAVSSEGVIYVLGGIREGILNPGPGSAVIGSVELKSKGAEDIFIVAFNQAGEPLWAVQTGSTGDVSGQSIAVDTKGNIYITGGFKGCFSQTDVESEGDKDIFVAKYNQTGNLIWAKKAGGSFEDEGMAIAVDQYGNSFVAGVFNNRAIFDSTGARRHNDYDFFIAKYDTNGKLLWMRDGGEYSSKSTKSIAYGSAVDAIGNNYVTGVFRGELSFGTQELKSLPPTGIKSHYNIFIVKYDPNGKPIWAKQGEGLGDDISRKITIDSTGNCYVTGSFYGPISFEHIKLIGQLTDSGDKQILVAKYDPTGKLQWAKQSSGPGQQTSSGNGIAVNDRGDCYITGFFDNEIQFGSIRLEGFKSRNMFIAKINADD